MAERVGFEPRRFNKISQLGGANGKANLQNSAKTNNSTFYWTLKGRWQWRGPVAADALPIIIDCCPRKCILRIGSGQLVNLLLPSFHSTQLIRKRFEWLEA